jgi:GNAT superfamily N-acetyltransferase
MEPDREPTLKVAWTKDLGMTDEAFIKRILQLDASVYTLDMQGTMESVSDRFRANKDSYVVLLRDDVIIGYICLFPINAALYKKVVHSRRMFDDGNITSEDILEYKENHDYHLFLISVVILPEFQNTGCAKLLADGFLKFIEDKNKENVKIKSVTAFAINDDGVVFLSRIGFQTIRKFEGSHTIMQYGDLYG